MKLLRRLTIRTQLSFTAVFIGIMVLIILGVSYLQMSRIINVNNEKYTRDFITQMKQTVYANKDVIDRLMMNVAFDMNVQQFLTERNTVEQFMYSKRIESMLINLRTMKEGIYDIIIHSEDGRWIDLEGGNLLTKQYRDTITAEDSFLYYGLIDFEDYYNTNDLFMVGFKIKYFQSGEQFNETIGTLFFIIEPQALIGETNRQDMEMDRRTFLVDRYNKTVSAMESLPIGSTLELLEHNEANAAQHDIDVDGVTYIANIERVPEINSWIISMVPESVIMRDMTTIRGLFAGTFIFGAIVLIFLFTSILNNILRPLKKLMTFMSTFKRGDLDQLKTRIDLDGYVEISVMANELNTMLNTIESLALQLLETNTILYGTELEKKKAELAFLRSQINPHFLYNTLEMIKGMAAVRGVNEIHEITMALGHIFRYSVKGEASVPLVTELSIIESYLNIQRLRFADRFTVAMDISEETLNYEIPKMILQPVIENAVFHGLEMKLGEGVLKISSYLDEQRDLVIIVEDNGIGMDEQRLAEVRAMLLENNDEDQLGEYEGIGFANVNKRIKLTCGSQYGLDIDSALHKGTRVKIRLSVKRGELN